MIVVGWAIWSIFWKPKDSYIEGNYCSSLLHPSCSWRLRLLCQLVLNYQDWQRSIASFGRDQQAGQSLGGGLKRDDCWASLLERGRDRAKQNRAMMRPLSFSVFIMFVFEMMEKNRPMITGFSRNLQKRSAFLLDLTKNGQLARNIQIDWLWLRIWSFCTVLSFIKNSYFVWRYAQGWI